MKKNIEKKLMQKIALVTLLGISLFTPLSRAMDQGIYADYTPPVFIEDYFATGVAGNSNQVEESDECDEGDEGDDSAIDSCSSSDDQDAQLDARVAREYAEQLESAWKNLSRPNKKKLTRFHAALLTPMPEGSEHNEKVHQALADWIEKEADIGFHGNTHNPITGNAPLADYMLRHRSKFPCFLETVARMGEITKLEAINRRGDCFCSLAARTLTEYGIKALCEKSDYISNHLAEHEALITLLTKKARARGISKILGNFFPPVLHTPITQYECGAPQ